MLENVVATLETVPLADHERAGDVLGRKPFGMSHLVESNEDPQ
jgi:hypothetical protein